MQEIWKDIPNYEGLYQVSNLGRVKSLERLDLSGYKRKEKILKGTTDSYGYKTVGLYKNKKLKQNKIHRLVALCFLKGNMSLVVNHIDSNRANNIFTNLELVTIKENVNHSFKSGFRSCKGQKHPQSKFTEKDVIEIRESVLSVLELTKKYNSKYATIYAIKKRYTWKHI